MLPFEKNIFSSTLSIDELKNNFENAIERDIFLSFLKLTPKEYKGEIDEYSFKINRISRYRNAFIPQIYGKFIDLNSHRIIKITITLKPFVAIFSIVWFGAVTFFSTLLLLETSKDDFLNTLIFTVFFIFFPYFLIMETFRIEAQKSKIYLKNILNAELIE
jgi:hypothetical protein